jgi:hypothetical protein
VPWDDPFLDSALDVTKIWAEIGMGTLGAAKRLTMREWNEGEQRQRESKPAKRLTAPYTDLTERFREDVNGWR